MTVKVGSISVTLLCSRIRLKESSKTLNVIIFEIARSDGTGV